MIRGKTMRHAMILGEWIATTDNSAGIGEKPLDEVKASDRLTAKFAARVALLEQWAANSEPEAILLHNFSGSDSWEKYVAGIADLFREAGISVPPITGSSESNISPLQSGIAVTMLGKQRRTVSEQPLHWYAYGRPLLGQDVLDQSEHIADLKKLYKAIKAGTVERIWPVGSGGIAHELTLLYGASVAVKTEIDTAASGGPATCVLLGVSLEKAAELTDYFGAMAVPLHIERE